MSAALPAYTLIGPGRMGLGLTLALTRAGAPPTTVLCRSERSRRRSRKLLAGVPTTTDPAKALREVELAVLAVPDDALLPLAERLAPLAQGRTWLHLSGCHGLEVLAPLLAAGGRGVAIHPLQSLPKPALGPERLAGSTFTVVAEERELDLARKLVGLAGGEAVVVPGAGRTLYHAAAVLACNDLVALLAQAFRLIEHATQGRLDGRALLPLVRRTLEGVAELGPEAALTGPVLRGDVGVVARHLEALAGVDHQALAVYRALGREAVALARGRGRSGADLNAIERILSDASGDE